MRRLFSTSRFTRLAMLVASLGLPLSATATEGGGSSYAVGVETNFSGAMLPEGSHWLVYYQHYSAGSNRDNSGNDNSRFAYFRSQADVLALRFSRVWPGVRVAGAQVESRGVLTLPTLDLHAGLARTAPLTPLDRSGGAQALGDTTLAPVLLGWHGDHWHQLAGVELIAPTGDYRVERPVNTGRNTWQLGLVYGVSWLPGTWEASARLRLGRNSRNTATDYRSGDELSLEFSAGRKLAPGWSAGINGYVYRQISDDVQQGASVNGNGNRGAANALGPYVAWSPSRQVGLVGKLQQEFDNRNRAEGLRLWLQGRYSF